MCCSEIDSDDSSSEITTGLFHFTTGISLPDRGTSGAVLESLLGDGLCAFSLLTTSLVLLDSETNNNYMIKLMIR